MQVPAAEQTPLAQGLSRYAHLASALSAVHSGPGPLPGPEGQSVRSMVQSHTPESAQEEPLPPQQLVPAAPQLTLPPALPSWIWTVATVAPSGTVKVAVVTVLHLLEGDGE